MAEIKFTKNELRDQQSKLNQLSKYLPTLQLKKAMLQAQAAEVRQELIQLEKHFDLQEKKIDTYAGLFSQYIGIDPYDLARVEEVKKRYENIAGVEIPFFEGVQFKFIEYSLFDTPPWFDVAFQEVRHLMEAKAKVSIAYEKKEAIEKELREVSIRVNLFEKVLIPRCVENIKKIKVFLGDQQLAAVSQAKVAKKKVLQNA
ncbi:MAG: V-type ATP synthase subunit D [Parachlamydiales bacterium]|nr:V-type ATP synthase subunit D [Parachlamydiales bacterium]